MLQRFIQFIDYLATGRNVIIITLIWLFYALFVMGLSGGSSADNIGPIDITFAPSPTIICNMIDFYGEVIRHDYFYGEMTWDGLYPLIYGLMLLLVLSYVMRRTAFGFIQRRYFLLVPLTAMGADYIENAGIMTLLLTYPTCSREIALAVSVFVTVKWVMIIISLLFLVMFFFLGMKHGKA